MESAIVIGGGIIGASCALSLVDAGIKVTLIDNKGCKATDYAAGILLPNNAGRAQGVKGLINRAALELWPSWNERLGGGILREGGLLQIAGEQEMPKLKRLAESLNQLGVEAELLETRQAQSHARWVSPKAPIAGAVWIEKACSADPAELISAVRLKMLGSGRAILQQGEVQKLLQEKNRTRGVRLKNGQSLKADWVVVAGGYSDYRFLPEDCRPRLQPQKGESIILELPEPLDEMPIIGTPGGSLVPRQTRQIWIGVTAIAGDDTATPSAGGMSHILQNALLYMPQLKECRVLRSGAGIRPVSPDNLPLVGHIRDEGLLIATGHGKDGILQSPLAGQTITQIVTQGAISEAGQKTDPAGRLRQREKPK